MRFSDAFLDQLRDRASIADYAGRRLTWAKGKTNRARGDYWACCPFHNEKSPSFHVLDQRGLYKCFGCGASGNIFGLVQALEGVSFPEAVERVAAMVGVAPPAADGPGDPAQAERRRGLYAALEAAQRLFADSLASPAGRAARAYLAGRGLDAATCARFGLGHAPAGWTTLLDHLRRAGATLETLIGAGLVTAGEDGRRPIDVFRDRVTFPIHDAGGKIIAFGARALDPAAQAKYLNSPETEIFHKGRTLYRLQAARRRLAESKGRGLVVAEGYLDVIALERAGAPAVAPLGTALTADQLALLWKAGPEPILCFDGDAAGARAADRALSLAAPSFGPDRTVRVLTLPAGQDPDDLFRSEGPEALLARLADAATAVEALFARECARLPLTTPEAKAGLKARLKEIAGAIQDETTRRAYFSDLLSRADAHLRSLGRPAPPATPGPGKAGWRRGGPAEPQGPSRELKARPARQGERQIELALGALIGRPSLAARCADALAAVPIRDEELNAIRDALISCAIEGAEVDQAGLSLHLQRSGKHAASHRLASLAPPRAQDAGGDAATLETEVMALLEDLAMQAALSAEADERRRAFLEGDGADMQAAIAQAAARRDAAARRLRRDGDPPTPS